jgi:hypothetical protein
VAGDLRDGQDHGIVDARVPALLLLHAEDDGDL